MTLYLNQTARTVALIVATLAAFAMGAITALLITAPAAGPLGAYAVPMGTLTVERDGTANYVPSVPFIPGACEVDDKNAVTGELHRPYYVCVPLHAPDGAITDWITADDGSATYGPGPWAFDPEEWGFVVRTVGEPS